MLVGAGLFDCFLYAHWLLIHFLLLFFVIFDGFLRLKTRIKSLFQFMIFATWFCVGAVVLLNGAKASQIAKLLNLFMVKSLSFSLKSIFLNHILKNYQFLLNFHFKTDV
jgi:hypothetical protein